MWTMEKDRNFMNNFDMMNSKGTTILYMVN